VLLTCVFTLTACQEDSAEVERLRARVQELEYTSQQKLTEANGKMAEAYKRMEEADEKIHENNTLKAQLEEYKSSEGDIEALKLRVEELESELTDQKKVHQDYVEKYRTSALGREFDSVTTIEGKTYNDVTLKEIDNLSVTLAHSAGVVRLAYDRLDASWAEEYGYNPEVALAQMEAEQQASEERARYFAEQDKLAAKVAAEQNAMQEELNAERDARQRVKEIAQLELEINKAENKIRILRDEISEREWRSVAGAQINAAAARVPQMKAEVLRLENYIDTAESRIRYLKSL